MYFNQTLEHFLKFVHSILSLKIAFPIVWSVSEPPHSRGHDNHLAKGPLACFMVWYGMVWYGMVWYGRIRYGTVRYGMVW